ncbi:MAG TPA: LPS-assembly protein LptD [Burkholderiales bacterium]|jgi:LPS-assembly protein|nr:LPS-assembly protein LptD [Burkholderiales bacterium]
MQLLPARKPAPTAARFAPLLFALCAGAAAQQSQEPVTIDAQSIEGISGLEVTARGGVEFRQDGASVYADYLKFNREFGRLEAEGGVRLVQEGDRFTGQRLRYDTTDHTGVLEEPSFLFRRGQTARGSAERVEFLGRGRYRLSRAFFTTCEPGNDDWSLEASQLDLDYNEETGTAHGVRLRFLDLTIAGTPYATFPLENRRKSGVLAPQFAQSTQRGTELGVPFYWNIAPEQDLTVTPMYMSERGEQLKGHYRYLDERYFGELRGEYLAEDKKLGVARSGYSWQHEQRFTPSLLARLDLNRVSDDTYFVDLYSQVRQVSTGNLQRDGYLQYNGNRGATSYYLQGRVQRFQTLQDPANPIVAPYDRVPQLNFSVARNDIGGLLDAALPAEYVQFTHPDLVEGERATLAPAVSVPLLAPGAFVTAKAGARGVGYNLTGAAPGQDARQNYSIPWTSLDSGLVFDRTAEWFGARLTQTLEPRLYYVYVPYRNQDQAPLFDTALADFTYAQLFTENRFVGGDRFGDANQVTWALTSRVLGAGSEERLRATIGQRYYFEDERVGLTPTSVLRTGSESDWLASIGGRIGHAWTFDSTVQYNPRESRTERLGVSVRFMPELAKVLNLSYRFQRDVQDQLDVSAQWPLGAGFYGVGRYNYSLRDDKVLEGIAGMEYNGGCWVFRAVWQRLQASTTVTSSAFLFQIEFNGFGQVGSDDTLTLLRRSVPGYSVTNPQDQTLVPPSARPRLPFQQVY